jgi:glycosyltransferase involved in cell wall biosynthesis
MHEYDFITGDKSNHQGLNPLLELKLEGGDVKFKILGNVWMGKALWQRGILSKSMFGDYDVFICLGNVNILSNWVACALSRMRGKRVLMWTHGLYGSESTLVRVLRCLHYRLASGLLLYGERASHLLQDQGFNAADLYVVANSLDVDRQNMLYEAMCSGLTDFPESVSFEARDLPTLLFIGRITKQKKIHLLLEAASILRERGQAVNVLIVGDGAELESL